MQRDRGTKGQGGGCRDKDVGREKEGENALGKWTSSQGPENEFHRREKRRETEERKAIESFLLWATWSKRKFTNHMIRAERDVEKPGPIS